MLTTHQTVHGGARAVVLVASTSLIGLLIASHLSAAPVQGKAKRPPRLLPAEAVCEAKPLATRPSADERIEATASDVWRLLAAYKAGRIEEAIAQWNRLELPHQSLVWRDIGLAAAYLERGDLARARDQLDVAEDLAPESAVVHYFWGMLRLAEAADEGWPDTALWGLTSRPHPQPCSSGSASVTRYLRAAIERFERVLEFASAMHDRAPLAPVQAVVQVPYPLAEADMPPTVLSLLAALQADNFLAQTHAQLAFLYAATERFKQADYHLDRAAAAGIPVPHLYRSLDPENDPVGSGRLTAVFRDYLQALQGSRAADNPSRPADDVF